MLRSNSKQVHLNVQKFIRERVNSEEARCIDKDMPFQSIARIIDHVFRMEKVERDNRYLAHRISLQQLFTEWMQGLPLVLDATYYYFCEAHEDVRAILEETEEEADKYTEEAAEEFLTWLIYREIQDALKGGKYYDH